MKKYRLKVDCPWGPKGAEVCRRESRHGWFWVDVFLPIGNSICPQDWPDFFEPIEEKSDVDRYAEWAQRQPCGTAKDNDEFIKKLLAAGLRVEDLK